MYQSIIMILLSASISQAATSATPQEITAIYLKFEAQKLELLKTDFSKKEAKAKVVSAYEALEKALSEVKDIESKAKNDLLTEEGNQMAYDLEILEPIKNLASGLMSKEDCNKARHEHTLNFPVVEDEDAIAIGKAIDKICK